MVPYGAGLTFEQCPTQERLGTKTFAPQLKNSLLVVRVQKSSLARTSEPLSKLASQGYAGTALGKWQHRWLLQPLPQADGSQVEQYGIQRPACFK